MEKQPFRSDIFYSIQNEDYRCEIAVLHHIYSGQPQRVLMVASSGENALSVLADAHVCDVDAVDSNPAQIQLCELRRSALRCLSRQEQLQLLGSDGADSGGTGAASRLGLYDKARPCLPPDSQAFWDARREQEIAFGLHYVGRNDVLMREVQDKLQQSGLTPYKTDLGDEDLPAWQAAYAAVMSVPYFLNVFGLPNKGAAAKLASLAGRTAECHFRALRQPGSGRNYFLTTALANRYALQSGEEGLPAYLQESAQRALLTNAKLDHLHLHTGNIIEQAVALSASSGPFDLISISNIVEWMSDGEFDAIVTKLRPCLKPNGALLARSASSSRMIIEGLARHLHADPDLDQRLPQIERGPWFRTIALGLNA